MYAVSTWKVWGVEASVVVDNPAVLAEAERLVRTAAAQIDAACSRFRPDSEVMRLQPSLARGAHVSSLLAFLVESALDAARWSDGDVDPTLGNALAELGYDRDINEVRLGADGAGAPAATGARLGRQMPGWRQISLRGRRLRVPEPLRLDLGATAKAVAADRAAALVRDQLGCGVMVVLGGDLATAGPEPDGGWQVVVEDLPGDPWQQVSLRAGQAMATSSTQKRRWNHAGRELHHILDPRFGLPAEPVWRSVTVAASSCLVANTWSTAGIVRGFGAVESFERMGIAGRLVDQQGRVVTTGGWPAEEQLITRGRPHG